MTSIVAIDLIYYWDYVQIVKYQTTANSAVTRSSEQAWTCPEEKVPCDLWLANDIIGSGQVVTHHLWTDW